MAIKWTEERIQMLGTDSDRVVAEAIGCSLMSVFNKRKQLGIPPGSRAGRPKGVNDKKQFSERVEDRYNGISEMLVTKSNALVADKYGISREYARQIRKGLGIEKVSAGGINRLSDVDRQYFLNNAGIVTDAELSRTLGVSLVCIRSLRKQYGIPNKRAAEALKRKALLSSVVDRLGVDSDHMIAAELNIHVNHVYYYRTKLGIKANPKYRDSRWANITTEMHKRRVKKLFDDGYTDAYIANDIGIPESRVGYIRRNMGLYRRRGRPARRRVAQA